MVTNHILLTYFTQHTSHVFLVAVSNHESHVFLLETQNKGGKATIIVIVYFKQNNTTPGDDFSEIKLISYWFHC